jgi:hypothetical protein
MCIRFVAHHPPTLSHVARFLEHALETQTPGSAVLVNLDEFALRLRRIAHSTHLRDYSAYSSIRADRAVFADRKSTHCVPPISDETCLNSQQALSLTRVLLLLAADHSQHQKQPERCHVHKPACAHFRPMHHVSQRSLPRTHRTSQPRASRRGPGPGRV